MNKQDQAVMDARAQGIRAGLTAAREAIKNTRCPEGYEVKGCSHWDDALAAIDALRRESDSCTTAKCAGCTCGCFHTPTTRRSYWQGVHAAREAVAALDIGRKVRLADTLAAIDALREKP